MIGLINNGLIARWASSPASSRSSAASIIILAVALAKKG